MTLRWTTRPRIPGQQGDIVTGPKGQQLLCPKCGLYPVVYNGNYFCDNWAWPRQKGFCDWALAHPATSARDIRICKLIGLDGH